MNDPHKTPAPDRSTVAPLHDRYPGARSFRDDSVDERLFFGRGKEIALLTHRIRATRLLLLFGKSGLGKTSLLQAGLFPVLRRDHAMLPVSIRFNQTDPTLQPADLVDVVIHRFLEVVRERGIDCQPGERNSLWEFFKTTDFWRDDTLLRPVLVLDQFEEVFTLQGAPFREALAAELKDLARRDLPDAVRRQRVDGNKPDYGTSRPDLSVILSFREEYLAELEALVADVPGLLEHRFRLGPLTRELAEEAIVKPAAVVDSGVFCARPFSYDEGSLRSILDFLSNEAGEVDPFQLQVLCRHIERSVVAAQASATEDTVVAVDDNLLGGRKAMEEVLSRFYEEALNRVRKRRQRRRARRLCERGLLSPAGNRISAEESTIGRGYKVKRNTLEQLIEARLLRKDTRLGLKGFYYELSHDSLTEPVQAGLRRSRKRRNILITGMAAVVLTLVFFGWLTAERNVREAQNELAQKEQTVKQVKNELAQKEQTVKQVKNELELTTRSLMRSLCESFSRNPPEVETLNQGGGGPEMVKIGPGSTCQGDITGIGDSHERPMRVVEFARPFAIGRYEVTFDEYDKFARATQRELPNDAGWGRDGRPVINVSWKDAVAYTKWLSQQTGQKYRLPSESEWEYAARAGTITPFWWGDEVGKNRANCAGCGSQWQITRYRPGASALVRERWSGNQTAPVGSFKPNQFGLYDTAGNVREWVLDSWHDSYDGAPTDGSAWLTSSWNTVSRGGSWITGSGGLRSASRTRTSKDTIFNDLGFRLAQDLE